jgi:hypothetical protein
MKIENLEFVNSNGTKIPETMDAEERQKLFPPMGVFKTVALEWSLSDGTLRRLDLHADHKKTSWEILPDRSGFLLAINSPNESTAMVVNADATTRFLLENPLVRSEFYADGDTCGFSYPGVESEQLGYYAYIWSPNKTDENTGVSSEYFLALDMSTGKLFTSHRVK